MMDKKDRGSTTYNGNQGLLRDDEKGYYPIRSSL